MRSLLVHPLTLKMRKSVFWLDAYVSRNDKKLRKSVLTLFTLFVGWWIPLSKGTDLVQC